MLNIYVNFNNKIKNRKSEKKKGNLRGSNFKDDPWWGLYQYKKMGTGINQPERMLKAV